jgi:dipeptidyl aminopeptidase/acylaminoacyl peptidase
VNLPFDVFAVAWTGQSDRLIALTQPTSDDLGTDNSAWLISRGRLDQPTPLTDLPKTTQQVAWVSDHQLAYLAQAEPGAPPGYHDLYTYDFKDRMQRDLTAVMRTSFADDARIVVDSKAKTIVIAVEEGMDERVARFHLDGSGADLLDVGQPVVSAVATNASDDGWVFLAGSATQAQTVFYASRLGDAAEKLATPDIVPADWRAAPSQRIEWRNQGETISGLLYLPPAATNGPVPLIVHVHGGPAWQFNDGYYAIVNLLVGQGWAVLEPNPRGSTGYGASFAAANKDDLGGADFNDIMTGVDAVARRFPIDQERMALIGYSYGGEMAGFAVGKTRRFKAIVGGGPVIGQFSEYGTEDSSWYDRWYFGKPDERFEAAWRQSPLSFAANAKTPFLLFQGVEDESDPMGQSLELYRALRQAGDSVELVTFPREKHEDLHRNFYGEVSLEPWHGVDLRNRMIKFIAEQFGPAPK